MATRKSFQLVVAATKSLGIGKAGSMPWNLPGDLKYFKELTSKTHDPQLKNAVIMGRKTWESIPEKFRPLKGRINVILTRSSAEDLNDQNSAATAGVEAAASTSKPTQSVYYVPSLEKALELLSTTTVAQQVESLFVIGGGQVYKDAIASPDCSAIHLTSIDADLDCDTFFPPIDPARFELWSATSPRRDTQDGLRYSFLCYVRAGQAESQAPQLPVAVAGRHEEYQYLDMIRDIIANGVLRGDRTGTGTLSTFGTQMRFNLRHSFPLLTTKRVFWRGVAEELLWFVRGSTNARLLQDKGIKIWDGNSSREYLDSVGLQHREEGDLGPVYGFQWRHFGAPYTDMHADYTGQGVDQLADVLHKIRNNPTDRRIIMSAWNPAAVKDMALPPCHMFCQFYVADGEVSCQMYQRSADMGLGVPFNIASYSLLTCLIAKVCGLRPGDFVHVLGDAHVYSNHVEPLKEQLLNTPRPFPVLKINSDKTRIEDFTMEDLELVGYNPHKKIEMKMAV